VEDSSKVHLDWSQTFAAIEASVVAGQHEQARQLLKTVNPKLIPREWVPRYARLANRVHYALYALKALHRLIAPENKLSATPATDAEKMIYAYALCLLGAIDEALEIFSTINTKSQPEAAFLKALTYFRRWNYAESIPVLNEYLANESLQPYRRLLGEINLIAAHVSNGEFDQALALAPGVESACREGNYRLLQGNCHELKAQAHFFKRNYEQALQELLMAESLLQGQQGLCLLFVEKWKILCELFKAPSDENSEELQSLQKKALALDDHETVRECDLFRAIVQNDLELLRKVIMGTPSESYRKRARTLYGKAFRQLGHFTWVLEGKDSSSEGNAFKFDPYKKQKGKAALYETQHLLALFEALTMDFYRPMHLGGLFKKVYPEEKFNPYTSPDRVLQLLKRLDSWFEQQQVPLSVQFKKSEFRLAAKGRVEISIQRGKKLSSKASRWSEVRSVFTGQTFSTAQVCAVLELSSSAAQRLIKQGLAEGLIMSSGRGRGVTYRFKSHNHRKFAA
jgi:hypothetical protein